MKLKKIYDHCGVISEERSQSNKINYSLNIFINNPNAQTDEERKKGKFTAKGSGSFFVSQDVARQLLSVEDVINIIVQKEAKNDKKQDGISEKDILSQMLFAFMDPESAKYLSTKDEIQFSFDYGPSDDSCIGILVAKPLGSPSFSKIMRLNKKALPNQFNKDAIDAQILNFSSMGSSN